MLGISDKDNCLLLVISATNTGSAALSDQA